MYYLGIDPGQSGGASLILGTGAISSTPSGEIRCLKFYKMTDHEVSDWIAIVAKFSLKAVIEKVHSMPAQGVSSSFKFGRSYGFLLGLLTAHQIQFQEVPPQTWQKDMKCLTKGDKNVSKAAAHRRWPKHSHEITHALADSLLLAEWLRLKDQR